MVRKLYLAIALTFVGIASVFAQSALKTTVTDAVSGETIPFAVVIIESKGVQVASSECDIDGISLIKPLSPGSFDVKIQFTGYKPQKINNVTIFEGKTQYLTVKLEPSVVVFKEFVVVEFKEPIIDPDTKSGGNVTREEFQRMATKNVNSVAAQTAGVVQTE